MEEQNQALQTEQKEQTINPFLELEQLKIDIDIWKWIINSTAYTSSQKTPAKTLLLNYAYRMLVPASEEGAQEEKEEHKPQLEVVKKNLK